MMLLSTTTTFCCFWRTLVVVVFFSFLALATRVETTTEQQQRFLQAGGGEPCLDPWKNFQSCLGAYGFDQQDCLYCNVFPLTPRNNTKITCRGLKQDFCNSSDTCPCIHYCNDQFLAFAQCRIQTIEYQEAYPHNCTLAINNTFCAVSAAVAVTTATRTAAHVVVSGIVVMVMVVFT